MTARTDGARYFTSERTHRPAASSDSGIVETYRTALSEQIHAQKFGESSYKTGAVPSGIVNIDVDTPTTDQVDTVKTSWVDKFGGGQRTPAVLGKAMSFQPLSWKPEDMEFIEARKLSVAECALMCGLRATDLDATFGESNTYGNRQQDSLQRITDSYGPWAQLVEEALADMLADGVTVEANPESLLRMSVVEAEELEALRIGNEVARRSLTQPTPPTPEEAE